MQPTNTDWKAIKPLDETFAACSAALQRVVEKLSAEHIEAANKLTEQQFIEALRQAIACGDFLKHVTVGEGGVTNGIYSYEHRQAVTYEPYREVERLKARIRELEARWYAIPPAPPCCECEHLKARVSELESHLAALRKAYADSN